ncbi:Myb/SANT-like domain containing protein [Quillaja saponaria]|uniref:Myb/SANT-like domain containing protein n=1 Tax=Quillaja saponaria TaxID=32244 RepID=A0AAD7LH69_QUISA|nr:Myb/SANT-like domain containing protein [Quillaja saponaria]
MWNAKPDLWKALIKAKPEAKKWMTTPIANYDKMLVLFAKKRAKQVTNQQVTLAKAAVFDSIHPVMSRDEVTHALDDLNAISNGANNLVTYESVSQVDSQAPSQSATSLKGKKRKAPTNAAFEREFESIREAIKDVAEAIREGNVIAERGRPRVYSEQEVFTELVKIGLDVQLRYRAYTFLIANAGRVRAFFGCPAQERKDFLLQMMTSPQDF